MYKTRIQNKIKTLVNNISIKELTLESLYKEKDDLPALLERDVSKVSAGDSDVITKIRERYHKKDQAINRKITNLLNSISEMENKKSLLEQDLLQVKEEEIVGKGLKVTSIPHQFQKYALHKKLIRPKKHLGHPSLVFYVFQISKYEQEPAPMQV